MIFCAGRRLPGEADEVDAGVGGERCAGRLAEPVHDVEHPGRQPGLGRRPPASSVAESGDHSAGFSTTVLPAASAGASRQVVSISGAFHGMISPATPTGLRIV